MRRSAIIVPQEPVRQGQVIFAITHTTPGGLREIWQDVAQGLRARGYDTGLVALYPQEEDLEQARRDGWNFIRTAPLKKRLGGPGLLAAMVAWLRRARPAAMITAMPMSNVLFPLATTIARTHTRMILSHHTPSFTYQRMLNRIDRWTGCLPCVAGIVSVSDAVGASFAAWPPAYRSRQCTIHNSLPERIESLIDRITAGTDRKGAEGRRIVAVGRLSRQKNYPQLLHAMALLPDASLDIIGAGEDEADLRDLIAVLGLEERVHLLGQMPREEALRHAAQADVFVQVSLFEGHSLALIEAARLGLPIVVSDVPVQVEGVTGERGELCGIAVPLDDPQALARALAELLDHPESYRTWAERSARLGRLRSSRALIDHYARLLASHGIVPARTGGQAPQGLAPLPAMAKSGGGAE